VEDAVSAISAHAIRTGEVFVRKGSVISVEMATRLKQADIDTLVAARLDSGDVGEDEAALRLAEALAGENVAGKRPFTGRSKLYAKHAGVLVVSRCIVDRINAVKRRSPLRPYRPTSRWWRAR